MELDTLLTFKEEEEEQQQQQQQQQLQSQEKEVDEKQVPKEFTKLIADFVKDMRLAFPEYGPLIDKWYLIKTNKEVYDYCRKVYRRHHHSILYRLDALFNDNFETNTDFLPGISFAHLWQFEDLSDKHRNMIWNYLQMVLISVMTEDEIDKTKISDTISGLEQSFAEQQQQQQEQQQQQTSPLPSPSPEGMEEFMNSKLAGIAKEIANETSKDFEHLKDASDFHTVFDSLFKNPEKLMSIVKNVSDKLDTKLKSGDMNETELMDEASFMMKKMAGMPHLNEMMQTISKFKESEQKQQQQQQQTKRTAQKLSKKKQKEEDKFFDEVFSQIKNR